MVPWLVGPALRVCRLEVGTELAESGLHVGRVCPGDGEEVSECSSYGSRGCGLPAVAELRVAARVNPSSGSLTSSLPARVAATVNAAFHVVLFAVLAAASPLALAATLAVIGSARPRADGFGFAAGYVVGTVLACLVCVVVGAAFVDAVESHGTIEAVVELLAGATLLVVGARAGRSEPGPERIGRGPTIMAGLHEMGPAAAFSMAAPLGFGGPKRLLFTLLAMTAISGAGAGPVADTTLVVSYVVLATALVWAPVSFMIVAPDRAEPMLERCESLVRDHARGLRVWISLTVGAVLVADGLLRLVG